MFSTPTIVFAAKKPLNNVDRRRSEKAFNGARKLTEVSARDDVVQEVSQRFGDGTPAVVIVGRDFSNVVREILDQSPTKKILIAPDDASRSIDESGAIERFALESESLIAEKRVKAASERLKRLVTDAYVTSQGDIARVKALIRDGKKREALSALSVLARKLGSALAKTGMVEVSESDAA